LYLSWLITNLFPFLQILELPITWKIKLMDVEGRVPIVDEKQVINKKTLS